MLKQPSFPCFGFLRLGEPKVKQFSLSRYLHYDREGGLYVYLVCQGGGARGFTQIASSRKTETFPDHVRTHVPGSLYPSPQ